MCGLFILWSLFMQKILGCRKPFELHGRFSRNGRWLLLGTYEIEPTAKEVCAAKDLNGVKYVKVVRA